YETTYHKKAFFLVENDLDLSGTFNQISFIEDSYLNFNQTDLKKREIFSQRLQEIGGTDKLGNERTGECKHYGRVS
ncbi:4Fe-4S ferredoxin, partial [Aliarcobacter butzleri]